MGKETLRKSGESKSWFRKDFSELRKEKKEKPKPKKKRDPLVKIEVKRELPFPKEKPKRVITSRTVTVYCDGDAQPWKFRKCGKQEVDEFMDKVVYEGEGFVRLGNRGLINLDKVTVISISKEET